MKCFEQKNDIDISDDHEQSDGYSAHIPDIIFRDALGRKIVISFDFIILEDNVDKFPESMIIEVNEVGDKTDDDSIFQTEFNLNKRNGAVFP